MTSIDQALGLDEDFDNMFMPALNKYNDPFAGDFGSEEDALAAAIAASLADQNFKQAELVVKQGKAGDAVHEEEFDFIEVPNKQNI